MPKTRNNCADTGTFPCRYRQDRLYAVLAGGTPPLPGDALQRQDIPETLIEVSEQIESSRGDGRSGSEDPSGKSIRPLQ